MIPGYEVERREGALILRGPVPVEEFLALSKLWKKQGFTELAPGLCGPLGASFVLVKSQADYQALCAEVAAKAKAQANGDRVREWLLGSDTGISSLTIVATLGSPENSAAAKVLLGRSGMHIPYDPADFGRCHRLLELVPEWRARLGEVAAACPQWRGLVEQWDELTRLYLQELPSGLAPVLYERMRSLRRAAS